MGRENALFLEKKIHKLVYVSSTAALGRGAGENEITEDMLWSHTKKKSAYSVSKFRAEMEAWRGMAEGLDTVIVNLLEYEFGLMP